MFTTEQSFIEKIAEQSKQTIQKNTTKSYLHHFNMLQDVEDLFRFCYKKISLKKGITWEGKGEGFYV